MDNSVAVDQTQNVQRKAPEKKVYKPKVVQNVPMFFITAEQAAAIGLDKTQMPEHNGKYKATSEQAAQAAKMMAKPSNEKGKSNAKSVRHHSDSEKGIDARRSRNQYRGNRRTEQKPPVQVNEFAAKAHPLDEVVEREPSLPEPVQKPKRQLEGWVEE